jgi:tetratricopeptide (TPR) repeat protein
VPDNPDKDQCWERQWELFHEALEREPEARAEYLALACPDDPRLWQDVLELIAAHTSGAWLDKPAVADVLTLAAEDAADSPAPFSAGELIAGRFEIVRLLGTGGMGAVYQARDRELKADVAIKTLRSEVARDQTALDRLRREIALARRVTHPNACRLFDLFRHESPEHGEIAFLTMELLDGETLAARLKREGAVPPATALPILRQVAAALGAAHRVGIVHRDLKCSNVMLVPDGGATRAVVTDFGLATLAWPEPGETAQLTQAGQLLGTPAYMAPEQLEGSDVSPATDVYALGLIAYEMVTGELPFSADTPLPAAIRRISHAIPAPSTRRQGLDARWDRAILACLERQPSDRFQVPEAMVAMLDGSSTTLASLSLPRARRRLAAFATGVLLVAALVAVPAWWWMGRSPAAALPFEERDWVLVSAFENRTGEPVFDGALEYALERELHNSRFLNVVPRERVADALGLMQQPPSARLTPEVAREVALRDGAIRALVRGRLDRIGSRYVLGIELVEPDADRVVASLGEEGANESDLLGAIRRVSDRLRASLGEEPRRIRGDAAALVKVTTPSLRALQLYTQADQAIAYGGSDAAAEELLRQAIREDAQFASAYIHLAFALDNQGRAEEALPFARRAFDLSDAVTEREQLFIRGGYYSMSGETQKAIASYEALIRLHPDHFWALNNLGAVLRQTNAARSIEHSLQAAALRPHSFNVNRAVAMRVATTTGGLGLARLPLERARHAITEEIRRQQPFEASWVELAPFHLAWVEGDLAGARAHLQSMRALAEKEKPPHAWNLLYAAAFCHVALGELQEARALFAQVRGFDGAMMALLLAGAPEGAREFESQRLIRPARTLVEPARIMLLAAMGRLDAAEEGLRLLEGEFRPHDPHHPAVVSLVRGQVASLRGRHGEAVSAIQGALQQVPPLAVGSIPYFLAVDALADSLDRSGRPDEALRALERAALLRSRSYFKGSGLWMRTQARLARMHLDAGRPEVARKLASELQALLARADSDHPLLAEVAELQR